MALSVRMSGAVHVQRLLSAPSAVLAQALTNSSLRLSCVLRLRRVSFTLAARTPFRWHLNIILIDSFDQLRGSDCSDKCLSDCGPGLFGQREGAEVTGWRQPVVRVAGQLGEADCRLHNGGLKKLTSPSFPCSPGHPCATAPTTPTTPTPTSSNTAQALRDVWPVA